jgi:hypothetical protein
LHDAALTEAQPNGVNARRKFADIALRLNSAEKRLAAERLLKA